MSGGLGLPMGATPIESALSDPTGAAPLADAALWVQHALLGTVATMIAILAIAVVGLFALSGRIELRRGATTIIGCFILFGASSIAAAFMAMLGGESAVMPQGVASTAPVLAPPPLPPPSVYDPYAGASVERR